MNSLQHLFRPIIFTLAVCSPLIPTAQNIAPVSDTAWINAQIKKAEELSASDQHAAIEILKMTATAAQSTEYPYGAWSSDYWLADNYSRLQELDKAENHITSALQTARNQNLEKQYFKSLIRYANVLQMQGKNYSGLVRLDSANNYFRKIQNTTYIVEVLLGQGNINLPKGNYAKALEQFNEALKLVRSKQITELITSCYSSIGNFYIYTNDPLKAKRYLREYIRIREKENDATGQSIGYANLSQAYILERQLDSAIYYLHKALEVIDNSKAPNQRAVVEGNLGKIYVYKQQYHRAFEYLSSAVKSMRENDLQLYLPTGLYWLGINYRGLDDYPTAAETFTEALSVANENRNWQSASANAYALYQTRIWKDHHEEALEHYIEYSNYKDSIAKEEESRIVGEMSLQLETQEKEYKIGLLEKQARIDMLKQTWLWVGLGLLLLLGVSVVYSLIMRSRKKQEVIRTTHAD